MRAADAVAPNLPYPPEERLPVRDVKPLARSKCRRRRRGTPPRRDADCASQWRFLRLHATHVLILAGVEIFYDMANRRYINSKTLPQWVHWR